MKYIDEPLRKYFEEAASGSETPGGGSIAGICGALAAAMMSMVCNFTIGRKKYAEVEEEVKRMREIAMKQLDNMLRYAVEDTEEFESVAQAYGMPKKTETERQARAQAIQEGCKRAIKAPEQIIEAALTILRGVKRLGEIGNKNLISDVGVSAIMAAATAESAALNVKINLKFIEDTAFTAAKHKKIDAELVEVREIAAEVKNKVYGSIMTDSASS